VGQLRVEVHSEVGAQHQGPGDLQPEPGVELLPDPEVEQSMAAAVPPVV
jgi:hypothetical protein